MTVRGDRNVSLQLLFWICVLMPSRRARLERRKQ